MNSQFGWELNGQGAAPHLDDNLAAGPSGTNLDWPGSSVSKSINGGTTWTTIDSPADGVWGFDLLSPTLGWVVGVNSLYSTSDGGSTWSTDGESPSGHLVTVGFSNSQDGFGLSTSGTLVSSTNGGRSWQAASFSPPLGAVCFASATTGYTSAQDGDVYETTNSGQTWTKVNTSPLSFPANQSPPLWSSLACSQTELAIKP
ncbi:MAG: WD40/YVTN/BNR-like repeat-containing protein [Acidimicrobiales bacterium]